MLPQTQSGDIVILRNFRVLSFSRQLYLKSQAESACAKLIPTTGGAGPPTLTHWDIIEAGGPVECGTQELVHAQALRQWWARRGHKVVPKLRTKREVVSLNKIEGGRFYDLKVCIHARPTTMTTPYTILVTNASDHAVDGMKSLSDTGSNGSAQEQDSKEIVISIDLRMQDARFVHAKCLQGSTVLLKNVLVEDSDGTFSGSIKPAVSGSVSVVKL